MDLKKIVLDTSILKPDKIFMNAIFNANRKKINIKRCLVAQNLFEPLIEYLRDQGIFGYKYLGISIEMDPNEIFMRFETTGINHTGERTTSMKTYIGTKVIKATQMSKREFTEKVKQENWIDSYPDEEGYLVEYSDGYRSWSPKDVFEIAYREITDQEMELINPTSFDQKETEITTEH